MASALDIVEMMEIEDQTALNLAAWEKALADPFLAAAPFRIETDRYGQIIMTPPPSPEHGEEQFGIGKLLDRLLSHGRVITECPLSTPEGVKAVDVAWISKERRNAQRGQPCLTHAPEICVEVLLPRNTRREMHEKRALYFAAGAEEVWFCHCDGTMEFFCKAAPETRAASLLCPQFPAKIEIDQ